MNHDESIAKFRADLKAMQLYPVDVTYLGRYFIPFGGHLPTEHLLRILIDGVQSGTLVFDGRNFYMRKYIGAFEVNPPDVSWTDEQILGARCFDGGIRERILDEMKATPQAPTASPSPTTARPISRAEL